MQLFRQSRSLPTSFDECSTIVDTVKQAALCSKSHPPTECCSSCPVQWTELPDDRQNGARYFVADGGSVSPSETDSKRGSLHKAVVRINKPIDAVMGSLVAESTERMATQSRTPSYVDGEVCSVVEPFGPYEHPSLPLVTTKKLRYSFGPKKLKREFFVFDRCVKFARTATTPAVAVRAFVSLDVQDLEIAKDYKRAFVLPGSGFLVQEDLSQPNSCYLTMLLDVNLNFPMFQRQQRPKATRDMLDVIVSVADHYNFLAQQEKDSSVTFATKPIMRAGINIQQGQNSDKVRKLMGTQMSIRQINLDTNSHSVNDDNIVQPASTVLERGDSEMSIEGVVVSQLENSGQKSLASTAASDDKADDSQNINGEELELENASEVAASSETSSVDADVDDNNPSKVASTEAELADAKQKEREDIHKRQAESEEINRKKLRELEEQLNKMKMQLESEKRNSSPSAQSTENNDSEESAENSDGDDEDDRNDPDYLFSPNAKPSKMEQEMLKLVNMDYQQFQWLKLTQQKDTNAYLLAQKYFTKSEDRYLAALWKQSKAELLKKNGKKIIDDVLFPPRPKRKVPVFGGAAATQPKPTLDTTGDSSQVDRANPAPHSTTGGTEASGGKIPNDAIARPTAMGGMFAELQAKAKAREAAASSSQETAPPAKPGPPMGMFAELQAKAKSRQGEGEGSEQKTSTPRPPPMGGLFAELKSKANGPKGGPAKLPTPTGGLKSNNQVSKPIKLWFRVIQAKLDQNVRKLSQEVEKCLNDKELWEERMENAPEREKVLKDQELEWFENQRKQNEKALKTMRKLIPVNIRELSISQLRESYKKKGGICPMRLAHEFYRNKLLHWIVTPTIEISKASFLTDSNAMFFRSYTDLDIVELRAIALKLEGVVFALDKDGAKKQWRDDVLKHVRNLVSREEGGWVKGGIDPKTEKRLMIQEHPLSESEKRREIYYYESTESIKAKQEKLRRLEATRMEREKRLKQIVEVELVEAVAEYKNALADSRNPDFIAYFGREKLRAIREQAKEVQDKLKKEQSSLEAKLKSSAQSGDNPTLIEYENEVKETNMHLQKLYGAKREEMESQRIARQKAIMREVITGALRRMKSRVLYDAFHHWTQFTAPTKPLIKAAHETKFGKRANGYDDSGGMDDHGILVEGVFDPNEKLKEKKKMDRYDPNQAAVLRQKEMEDIKGRSKKNRESVFQFFNKTKDADHASSSTDTVSTSTSKKPMLPGAEAKSKGLAALLAEAKSNLPPGQLVESENSHEASEETVSTPEHGIASRTNSLSNDTTLNTTDVKSENNTSSTRSCVGTSAPIATNTNVSTAPLHVTVNKVEANANGSNITKQHVTQPNQLGTSLPVSPILSRNSNVSDATSNLIAAIQKTTSSSADTSSSTTIKSGDSGKLWERRTGATSSLGLSLQQEGSNDEGGLLATVDAARRKSQSKIVAPVPTVSPVSNVSAQLSALGLTNTTGDMKGSTMLGRGATRSVSPSDATASILGDIRKHSTTPTMSSVGQIVPTMKSPSTTNAAAEDLVRGLTKSPSPLVSHETVSPKPPSLGSGNNNLTDDIRKLLNKSRKSTT